MIFITKYVFLQRIYYNCDSLLYNNSTDYIIHKGGYIMIKIHLSRILGEKRITQAELTRQTGIRPSTISEIYNEIAERLNVEYLDRICEYLNCDITDLIEYIPDKQKKTGRFLIKENHGNHKN